MAFALDLKKWCEKADANVNQIVRNTVGNVIAAVDSRSPVGNRELWAINNVTLMNREMFQLFREDQGKSRLSARAVAKKFPGLKPKGYVGGRFRANWQLGLDAPPTGELYDKKATSYPSGAATVAGNQDKIPILTAGGRMYYLVNNLPYARRLEEGWSSQAPQGMVAITVLEFQQYVDAAVAMVNK